MRWIRKGQVRIDQSRSKPFCRVYRGQTVRIPPFYEEASGPLVNSQSENPFLLKIIYEDTNILVVAKPPNLPTQPGSKQTDSVHDRIQGYFENVPWKPALVHRLDKDVSGLLVLAKTYAYLRHLQNMWLQGTIQKMYLTWVCGETRWSEWSELVDTFTRRGRRGPQKTCDAISWVKTLRNEKTMSLVGILLHTGRKHQIRIQMAQRHFPIVGDKKYGQQSSSQGILLHATHLAWDEYAFTLAPPWQGTYRVQGSDYSQAGIQKQDDVQ
jgi:23S rRNA pseudouridine955/2504/2580 synthase